MNQKLNAHLKIKNVIILNKLRSKFYEEKNYYIIYHYTNYYIWYYYIFLSFLLYDTF